MNLSTVRAIADNSKMTVTEDQIRAALTQTINKIEFDQADYSHHGKVRDSFIINNKRVIVVSDRVSAFDFILGTIPYKGAVLNQIAAWWFNQLGKIDINHHLISTPHPNVSIVKDAAVIPIEVIVRGYLTGTTTTSSWYAYEQLDRVICGIEMPEGMKKNQKFENIMVTPTTKPDQGHDQGISTEQIIDQGLLKPFCELMCLNEEEIWHKIEKTALKLFAHGKKIAKKQGLILVDTKYEMGVDEDGELMLVDEVHTPDSSRYWIKQSYKTRFERGLEPESLDKEFVRRMIVDAGYDVDSDENPSNYMTDEIRISASEKYIELYERITGTKFEITNSDSIQSVLQNMA